MELIRIALTQYGVHEKIEHDNHPQITKYFAELGYDISALEKETPWCSAFANWVAKTAGYEYSGKPEARSWLTMGESTKNPTWGDIAVLWEDSPESSKGYVGFFVKETKRYVYLLGGDQRNRVCIKAYLKNKVIDFRKLKRAANQE